MNITQILQQTNNRKIKIRVHNTPYYVPINKIDLKRLLLLMQSDKQDIPSIDVDNTITITTTYITVLKQMDF